MSRTNIITACALGVILAACAAGDHVGEPMHASGKADEGDEGDARVEASFLASLPGWGRYIALDKLDRIVPVYLEQTQAVLARIDALPAGTVDESTRLDEIPIPDLFEAGNVALREVVYDSDFAGGRRDHDVAWLRQSALELEALPALVNQAIADGTNPPELDQQLTNSSYWRGDGGTIEINVGVAAVSRFYCNLDIRITDEPGGPFTVEAAEYCD